ncbi:caspase, EACC1-associated type [Streptomyces anulatus]|uniref:caspase, EACC1-associated type n=1 Tax=Streptomyces anulatus TaxID=1892 RepID=UPI003F4D286E
MRRRRRHRPQRRSRGNPTDYRCPEPSGRPRWRWQRRLAVTAPDPAGSRAVLIGVHTAADALGLGRLPAVEHNLSELRRVLTDGTVWALPDEHCLYIPEPAYPHEVLAEVERAAVEATDTLLLYYAGHGLLVGEDRDLHLALSGVRWDDDCLNYGKLRTRLRQAGRKARRTVVILDCCYSGKALNGEMGVDPPCPVPDLEVVVARKAAIEGVCVLTASAATRKALAPVGDKFTAFTGELIHVLCNGVPGADEFLNMTMIYDAVATRLADRPGVPEPQFGTLGHGGGIVLAPNRAYPAAPSAADAPTNANATEAASSAPTGIQPSRQPPDRGLPPVVGTYKGIEIRSERVLLQFLRSQQEGHADD